jgi:VanZ family protein
MRYLPTILVCTLVLILSTINTGVLPKTDVPSADKIVHTIMYFGITLILMLNQTSYLHKKITKRQLYFAFLFSVGFGTSMEIIQHFLPWRSGSIYDFIANTLGVLLAIVIVLFITRFKYE